MPINLTWERVGSVAVSRKRGWVVSSRRNDLHRLHSIFIGCEIAIISLSNFLISYLRFGQDWYAVFFQYPGQPKILIYPLLWLFSMYSVHAWDKSLYEIGSDFFVKVLQAAWRSLLLFGCFAFLAKFPISRLWVAANILSTVVALLIFRSLIRFFFNRSSSSLEVTKYLYIGTAESMEKDVTEFRDYFGFSPEIESLDPHQPRDFTEWIRAYTQKLAEGDFQGVIIGYGQISDASQLRLLADIDRDKFVNLFIVSRISPLIPRMEIQESPTIVRIRESHVVGSGAVLKRLFDVTFSFIALVLLTPLMLIIALLVKITSRGPIFFSDKRIGQYGELFTFPKFRSMYVGAADRRLEILGRPDEEMAERYKRDPRITPFGRFIRRWSLDELPQLWPVFLGRMSIVGPRPILREEILQVRFEHQLRFIAKPGLTGLWQVTGRKEVPWEDRMLRDIAYIEQWTFAKDLVLILKTVKAIISGEGAH